MGVVWRLLIFSGFLSGTQRNGTKRWSFHDYQDTPFSLHTRGRMRTGVPLRRMNTIRFSRVSRYPFFSPHKRQNAHWCAASPYEHDQLFTINDRGKKAWVEQHTELDRYTTALMFW